MYIHTIRYCTLDACKVRKFDHPEEDLLKCLLPLHTRELGRLSIPESEREADPLEDGGPVDTRTDQEIMEEYTKFMDDHGVPEKVGSRFFFALFGVGDKPMVVRALGPESRVCGA